MTSLLAIKHFLQSKLTWILGSVVIIGLLLALTYYSGKKDGRKDVIIEQQEREIKAQKKIKKADSQAADRRLQDYQYDEEQQREIEDAVRNAKGPDDLRARRGCVILRQQGRDTTIIPACSGFED